MPLLSIITVTFNAQAMVEETIQSVLQQSFTDYEFWVIDGNSTDGTQDIVKKYSGKVNLLSEKDEGIYHAMNKGIERSKGRWLYFLNAGDTLFNKDVLKSIFDKPITNRVELIYGNIKTKNHPSGSDYTLGHPIALENFHYGIGLCHQAAFTNRNAFDTIGSYNYKDYPILADQEWFVRFLKAGGKSVYMNIVVANYEVVGESFIKRIQNYNDHLKIVGNHFSSWVRFQNKLRSPFVKLKIKLLQNFGKTGIYKFYRSIFFSD